jgi:hypothetical protein
MTPTNQKCADCVHFFIDGEGWELPQYDYANCKARPNFAYLKSFPFKNTKCKTYEAKEPKP